MKTIVASLPTSVSSQMTLVYLSATVSWGKALSGNHFVISLAQAPMPKMAALHGKLDVWPDRSCNVTALTESPCISTPTALPMTTSHPLPWTASDNASINFLGDTCAMPLWSPMSCPKPGASHAGEGAPPAPRPMQRTRRWPMRSAPNCCASSSCRAKECFARGAMEPRCQPESPSVRKPPALPEEWQAMAHFSTRVTGSPRRVR
mmetsp:Transcript_31101/g.88807  ORF Transcript_31101/g.88807 Transcript_31101/m.88807 type:complete len:205 (+) Transcript_31101:539-1153(+)